MKMTWIIGVKWEKIVILSNQFYENVPSGFRKFSNSSEMKNDTLTRYFVQHVLIVTDSNISYSINCIQKI